MEARIFDKFFWWTCAVCIIIIILLCFFPYWLTGSGSEEYKLIGKGEIGDAIGGTMGPFVAIFAAILTFLAFWVQYKANLQQREDIALQRFESNLFQLINIHEEITNNLSVPTAADYDSFKITGRDVFRYLYLDRKFKWHKGINGTVEHGGLDALNDDKSLWGLDHYFSHLYQIFNFISTYDPKYLTGEQKYSYSKFVTGVLSEYELLMLFYHALIVADGGKFIKIIEDFTIFNNLHIERLSTENERKYYHNLKDDSHSRESVKPYEKAYKRSAFTKCKFSSAQFS